MIQLNKSNWVQSYISRHIEKNALKNKICQVEYTHQNQMIKQKYQRVTSARYHQNTVNNPLNQHTKHELVTTR